MVKTLISTKIGNFFSISSTKDIKTQWLAKQACVSFLNEEGKEECIKHTLIQRVSEL